VPEELAVLRKRARSLAEAHGVEAPDVIVQEYLTPTYIPPRYAGRPLILLNPKAYDPLEKQLCHEFKHYLQIKDLDVFALTREEVEKYEREAREFADKCQEVM